MKKDMYSLFDMNREQEMKKESPLAMRMRPETLDEFVGQEDKTSTIEKPSPAACTLKAVLIAFFAFLIFFTSCNETLSTYTAPSSVDRSSQTLTGYP